MEDAKQTTPSPSEVPWTNPNEERRGAPEVKSTGKMRASAAPATAFIPHAMPFPPIGMEAQAQTQDELPGAYSVPFGEPAVMRNLGLISPHEDEQLDALSTSLEGDISGVTEIPLASELSNHDELRDQVRRIIAEESVQAEQVVSAHQDDLEPGNLQDTPIEQEGKSFCAHPRAAIVALVIVLVVVAVVLGVVVPNKNKVTTTPTRDTWTDALLECSADTVCTFGRLKGGISESYAAASIHKEYVTEKLMQNFHIVSEELDIPVAILLAIASKASNMGSYLGADANCTEGWGNLECSAFGLMQVDKTYHTIQGVDDPFGVDHIRQAAGIFDSFRDQVAARHSDWSRRYILKGTVVAYNVGPEMVQTIEDMDMGTSDNDYGSDAMARAYWFYLHVYPGDGNL